MTRRYPSSESGPSRFTRRWWWSATRNLLWVALITALIWVYADMEFIDTESIKLTLRLTADPRRAVLTDADGEPLPPEAREHALTFRLRGSRRSLARLNRTLAALGSPVEYDVSRGREPQPQDIETRGILADLADLEKLGITILSVSPQWINDVPLEPVVRQTIPVKFRFVGGKPESKPSAELRVRLSESKWQRLRRQAGPEGPRFVTEPIDLSRYQAGEEVSEETVVDGTIAGVKVTEPTTVPVAVTVAERPGPQRKQLTLTLDVEILTPPSWAGRGDGPNWQRFVFLPSEAGAPWSGLQITVDGPAEDIDKLAAARDKVHAYVPLTAKSHMVDMKTEWAETVVLRFPPHLDVRLVERDETGRYREVDPPKVWFKVRRRGEGP
ncbi:MAG: hypothetical protein ACOC8F_01145 [Planctomycetota bacterium]